MFPSINLDNMVQSINYEDDKCSTKLGRVFYLHFDKKGNANVLIENGKPKECDNLNDKIKMYVQILLRTKLNKYKVYKDTNFGMSFFNYIGNKNLPKGFLNSELKREIETQLKKLNVVDSITDFKTTINNTKLIVDFTIILKDRSVVDMTSEVII